MSTLCPYRIIKGDDGLSVKVEWDAHYLTDEQIGMVREYVADIEAENAKLRELVRDMSSLADQACDAMPTCYKCPMLGAETCDLTDAFQRMRELGVEVE